MLWRPWQLSGASCQACWRKITLGSCLNSLRLLGFLLLSCFGQAVSVTPLECPVGCALFFPSLMTDCEDSLRASGLSADDMAEYERFSERCLDQDACSCVRLTVAKFRLDLGLLTHVLTAYTCLHGEYAEDLLRQGCDIDLVPENGRRMQDVTGDNGYAKLLQTDPNTCSWDSFDGPCIRCNPMSCVLASVLCLFS